MAIDIKWVCYSLCLDNINKNNAAECKYMFIGKESEITNYC